MTTERIKELYDAQPFKPFIIHRADGRDVPVHHREFIMTVPPGRTIVVAEPDGSLHILDVFMITDLEVRPELNGSRAKRKRR